MILAVVGSRKWADSKAIESCLSFLSPGDTVVSGGAKGADQLGEVAANIQGLRVISYRPVERDNGTFGIDRWETFKDDARLAACLPKTYPNFAAAAFARNTMIVEAADRGVAFWDGESTGTADTIKKFRKAGKPIRVFTLSRQR